MDEHKATRKNGRLRGRTEGYEEERKATRKNGRLRGRTEVYKEEQKKCEEEELERRTQARKKNRRL